MKKIKLVINILIFLIVIFSVGNTNIVIAAKEITCLDIVKDDYDNINYANGLMNGGLPFASAVSQVSAAGENFIDIYNFLVDGVDIKKIEKIDKSNGNENLKKQYINALNGIVKQMENISGADALWAGGYDMKNALAGQNKTIEGEKSKVKQLLKDIGARQDQIDDITGSFDDVQQMTDSKDTNDKQQIADTVAEATENNKDGKNNKIFKQPSIDTGSIKKDGTLEDMISDADTFVDKGDQSTIKADEMKNLSGRLYNILLQIGIGASIIIGLILGIKFMLSGVEEKAEVKKMIWVYVIGCIVTFGSFGIWKLVVEILQQM